MPSQDGTNLYCRELGIEPPHLASFVGRGDVPLLRLLILTLLEHGGPLSLSAAAERLEALGVLAPTGDLTLSLQKAWHGLPPIVKEADDRMGLDLRDLRLKFMLIEMRLLPPLAIAPPPDGREARDPNSPLTLEEVAAALKTGSRSQLSGARIVAAVLDATGGHPLTLDGINRQIAELESDVRLTRQSIDYGMRRSTSVVVVDESGGLTLNPDDAVVTAMRAAIRGLAAPVLRHRARQRLGEEARDRFRRELAQDRKEAEALRRAVLHACIVDGTPVAVTVLDASEHTLQTVTGAQLADLDQRLADFDVIAAPDVRTLLASLRVETGRLRLVDLARHPRTVQLNRAGRKLTLTTARLIGWSTGLGRAAPDPRRLARLAHDGVTGKLLRRLESEAKALFAFYRYGVAHRGLRVHWGFLDEIVPVEWAEDGDRYIGGIFAEALDQRRAVDVVTRSAPGWEDPWSRAWRVEVVACERGHVTVSDGIMSQTFWLGDVQAVRFVASPQRAAQAPTGLVVPKPDVLRQCINWLISEMGYELMEDRTWQSPEIEEEIGVPEEAEAQAVVTPETFRGVVSLGDFQRRVRAVIERARQEATRRWGRGGPGA